MDYYKDKKHTPLPSVLPNPSSNFAPHFGAGLPFVGGQSKKPPMTPPMAPPKKPTRIIGSIG